MVEDLIGGLTHLDKRVRLDTGVRAASLPGAGAAGGMGFGAVAFFKARLRLGIEIALDAYRFDEIIKGADLIVSGEGRFDTQSLRGKSVIGAVKRAKDAGIPLVAIVGNIGCGIEAAYDMGVTGVFSIDRAALPLDAAKKRAKSDLRLTVYDLMRVMKAFEKE